MTDHAEVVERLDRIAALLTIAFSAQIDDARHRIRANPVAAALLDSASDWVPAGELQERVAKAANKSTRTVRTEIAELLRLGAIRAQGPSNALRYMSTGLI